MTGDGYMATVKGATALPVETATHVDSDPGTIVREVNTATIPPSVLRWISGERPCWDIPGAADSRLSFRTTVTRREDLLSLRLDFHNLRLVGLESGGGDFSDTLGTGPGEPRLERVDLSRPGFMAVVFPPQTVAETIVRQGEPPDAPPIAARIAAPTRLVFAVEDGVPFRLDALLDWARLEASLVCPDGLPAACQTTIELPWRLVLSPLPGAGWAHAVDPVTHDGVTEVWHTRMATATADGVDEHDPGGRLIRAVAVAPRLSQGLGAGGFGAAFDTSLNAQERATIVERSGDRPVSVDRLHLGTLGGSLVARGDWPGSEGVEGPTVPRPGGLLAATLAGGSVEGARSRSAFGALTSPEGAATAAGPPPVLTSGAQGAFEWRHRATFGRDHYVRTVSEGHLLPFGHRAAFVRIHERKFLDHGASVGAYLERRVFVVLRQRELDHPDSAAAAHGRDWPLRHITALDERSPLLESSSEPVFVPRAAGAPVQFRFLGLDHSGRQIAFTAPAYFVPVDASPETVVDAVADYNSDAALHRVALGGQTVALAPPAADADTDYEVIQLAVRAVPGPSGGGLAFRPALVTDAGATAAAAAAGRAQIRLAALDQIRGAQSQQPWITFDAAYVSGGFHAADNPGEVIAAFTAPTGPELTGIDATFDEVDRVGGLATPNVRFDGLSRLHGPVSGLEAARAGAFDPQVALEGLNGRLLGGLDLLEIVAEAALDAAPVVQTRPVFPDGADQTPSEAGELLPESIETTFHWEPALKAFPPGVADPIFDPGEGADLVLDARHVQHLQPPASALEVLGRLGDFTLNLPGADVEPFLAVSFTEMHFEKRGGSKVTLSPRVQSVELGGAAAFLNTLLDPDVSGLSFGGIQPYGHVRDGYLEAGLEIPLPSFAAGIFSISELVVLAGVSLPLNGDPVRLRLGLSKREDQARVTVYGVGGGCYFSVAVGLDGLESLEAGIALCGDLSFDVGVASGGVYACLGIAVALDAPSDGDGVLERVTIYGSFHLSGGLEVLGILSVFVDLSLELELNLGSMKLQGTATLELNVKIFIFEVSVRLEVQRTVSLRPNDPSFAAGYDREHWEEYAAAFAPLEA